MKNNLAESEDLFDEVSKDGDIFDELSEESMAGDIFDDTAEITSIVKAEVEKFVPQQKIVERIIEKKIIQPEVFHVEPKVIEAPPQIIKEVRVEVEKKDKTRYVEESKYLDLLVKISKLEGQIKEARKIAEQPIFVPGGTGVIGIPAPEPNPAGYVLTVNSNRKAEWKVPAGLSGFTVTNGNTLQSFDVTNTSLDELARVVGTIITQLQP